MSCDIQGQYYIICEPPTGIYYKKTGKGKDHKLDEGEIVTLLKQYNLGNITGGFPKRSDVSEGRESILISRVTNILRDIGMTGEETERYIYFLGNRACITCPTGLRSDVKRGEFQCSACRGHKTPPSSVDKIREHALIWLSNTFEEWCLNLKPLVGIC